MPGAKTKARRDDTDFTQYKEGGAVKSRVNEAGNYTKPGMRKSLFNQIKNSATQTKDESPAAKPEELDATEVANQIRQAFKQNR